MSITTAYKFQLDKSSKKFHCPECTQKTFVRYVDSETGEYMPDEVGRCDRESKCAYHYTPKQYFTDKGEGYTPTIKKEIILQPEIIDFHPLDYVTQSMRYYQQTNFASWLYGLFGSYAADKALVKYFVGRSKRYDGKAAIFWQIDINENVRAGKIIPYNPTTGKRIKAIKDIVDWVHCYTKKQHYLKQCFFGEFLLAEHPEKPVYIFESEKSAVVASIFFPDAVCLATGGSHGTQLKSWSSFKVLKDRNIILFPDHGLYNIKSGQTCFEKWTELANDVQERLQCKIKVSRVLEDNIPATERNGQDLADMLIKQDNGEGWAMMAPGYPLIFDLYSTKF